MGKKPFVKKAKKGAAAEKPEEGGAAAAGGEERKKYVDVSVGHAKVQEDPSGNSITVESLSITFMGHEILQDADLKLHKGNRYGLLGPNGCGKSTLMKSLAQGEVPWHKTIDHFFVEKEVDATEESALDCVLKVDREKQLLEAEADRLTEMDQEAPGVADRLSEVYERLDVLEADPVETRAARILFGLGFDKNMQQKKCKEYSGGWRMRIALAQGLFINPNFLLLDEPSNHLDIEAVVWLEAYLQKFTGILLCVSHSQDFLNNVCTNILRMHLKKIELYKGNYTSYMQTREEKEEHQAKRHQWEQDQVKNMEEYIRRFGHGSAKLAKQAQSKEKTLAKMKEKGMTQAVVNDHTLSFYFPDSGKLTPPIIQFTNVTFGYPKCPPLYTNVSFGVDQESRIALVGPNGAGKTTLQKLMCGLLEPTDGVVTRNGHCRIARFAQHFVDVLPMDKNPLEYMKSEFPEELKEIQECRKAVGRFGISGGAQLQTIETLSEGQKARLLFAWIAFRGPHMLLLDEPTNCLDLETIDSLAEAINNFEGGTVLVSHDIRLISQVAKEIWIVENGKVEVFKGDITKYKKVIQQRMEAANARAEKDQKKK